VDCGFLTDKLIVPTLQNHAIKAICKNYDDHNKNPDLTWVYGNTHSGSALRRLALALNTIDYDDPGFATRAANLPKEIIYDISML
jgi:hypothetical protein